LLTKESDPTKISKLKKQITEIQNHFDYNKVGCEMQTYAQEIVAPNRDRALAEILGHRVSGMLLDNGKKES
jgi:hypothetical protein